MKQLSLLAATVFFGFSCNAFAVAGGGLKKPSAKDLNEQALFLELTGKDISKENDIDMYAQMVSAFNREDEIAFKSRLQSLLTRFPNSPFADNALYLAGRLAVNNRNYAEAIKYFGKIEREYPRSNKIVATQFAKAMTYKKMNLPELSIRVLKEVRSKYMGSPESFRADAELKMFK